MRIALILVKVDIIGSENCFQLPTATPDLQDLVAKGILKPVGEGRGRNYQVMI